MLARRQAAWSRMAVGVLWVAILVGELLGCADTSPQDGGPSSRGDDADAGSDFGPDLVADSVITVDSLDEPGSDADGDMDTDGASVGCGSDSDCPSSLPFCITGPGCGDGICAQLCASRSDCADPRYECTTILGTAPDTVRVCVPPSFACDDRDGDGAFGGCGCAPDLENRDCDDDPDGDGVLRFPENPEICDNIDNDCDGRIDEEAGMVWPAGASCPASIPEAARGCAWACTGPGLAECLPSDGVGEETCDGVDNDCDGSVDEGVVAGAEGIDGRNACGGCPVLAGEPGAKCGPTALWTCDEDGQAVECLDYDFAVDGEREVLDDLSLIPPSTFELGGSGGTLGSTSHLLMQQREFTVRNARRLVERLIDLGVCEGGFVGIDGIRNPFDPGCLDCPLVDLSYYDSLVLADAASIALGFEPCYQCASAASEAERNRLLCSSLAAALAGCGPDVPLCNADRTDLGESIDCAATPHVPQCVGSPGCGGAQLCPHPGTPRRECDGVRLPTSMEWEVAARSGGEDLGQFIGRASAPSVESCAGQPALAGYAYYCGNSCSPGSDDDCCNQRVSDSSTELHCVRPQPSGELCPNAWHLYDVLGNASEHVYDCLLGPDDDSEVDDEPSGVDDYVGPRESSTTPGVFYCNESNRTRRRTGGFANPSWSNTLSHVGAGPPASRENGSGVRFVRTVELSGLEGVSTTPEPPRGTCDRADDPSLCEE
jgi:hypothetical protein